MRSPLLIIGVILLIVGGLISAGLIGHTEQKQVAKFGPLEVTSTEEKKPPVNLGYVLLGIGTVVLVVGAITKK